MHQSFLETDYIVFKNHKFENNIVLKINQKVLENDSANELTQPCALITAWNPLPDILSLKENRKRSEELKNHLIERGYVFHEAMGISSDKKWSEESILSKISIWIQHMKYHRNMVRKHLFFVIVIVWLNLYIPISLNTDKS